VAVELQASDLFPVGLFAKSDDHFSIIQNCSWLIEFHQFIWGRQEKLNVFLMGKKVELQLS